MHHTQRAGLDRWRLRILLVTVLLLASSLTSALAGQATPAPDGDTKLYIGHAGGFIARIPAAWDPDRALDYDYAGRDGFVSTVSTAFTPLVYDGPEPMCADVAVLDQFGGQGAIASTTWRGISACTVRVAGEQQDDPVALVFARPEPDPLGETVWVAVIVDAEHFDQVTDSISFDVSGVTAEMYLDSALDLIESRSLWRDAVDWTALREQAHARLGGFADSDQLWTAQAAIGIVIDALHDAGADGHTRFFPAMDIDTLTTSLDTYSAPDGASLDRGIGYLSVPAFTGGPEQASAYVDRLHTLIVNQAPAATCGWIVDLRANGGGEPTSMIAALSPILPAGHLLTVRGVNGEEVTRELLASGAVAVDGAASAWSSSVATPADPRLAAQPVALLIGPWTASTGESTAIAFVDRDRTAFFGEPTMGAATTPAWIPLLDGSLLMVSTGWMVGPQGAIYPEGIAPDVTVSPSEPVQPLADDPVVQAATDWLLDQPGCDQIATPAA